MHEETRPSGRDGETWTILAPPNRHDHECAERRTRHPFRTAIARSSDEAATALREPHDPDALRPSPSASSTAIHAVRNMHCFRPREIRSKSMCLAEIPLKMRRGPAIPARGEGTRLVPAWIDVREAFTRKGRKMAKSKMMTKSQIAGHLANKFEITKKQSTQILEELATLAAKQAKTGFVFPGVGKLVVVN